MIVKFGNKQNDHKDKLIGTNITKKRIDWERKEQTDPIIL